MATSVDYCGYRQSGANNDVDYYTVRAAHGCLELHRPALGLRAMPAATLLAEHSDDLREING